MENAKEAVLHQIRSAFFNVKRPSDAMLLHFPDTGDEIWVASFVGATDTEWTDVAPSKIEYESSALTVFSPVAFVYYLPAYMTWVLNNYEASSSNTIDYTLYALDLTERPEDLRNILEERFFALSEEQARSVLAFLKYMSQLDNCDSRAASNAIGSYWMRFEEEA